MSSHPRKVLPAIVLAAFMPIAAKAGPCDDVQYSLSGLDVRALLDCIKELKFSDNINKMTIDALQRQNLLQSNYLCFMGTDLKQLNPNGRGADAAEVFCPPQKLPSKRNPQRK